MTTWPSKTFYNTVYPRPSQNQKPKELLQLKINTIHHCRRNLSETEAYQKKRQRGAPSCGNCQLKHFGLKPAKVLKHTNVKPLLITKVLT